MKILIAGGFGVGKTTAVGTVSDIEPISTEEYLTEAGAATDSLTGVAAKSQTTVAFDFGRVDFELPVPIELMLFGTPGQERFRELWFDLARGAVGAVVLADTRRLEVSFDAVTFCEHAHLPFVVGVNQFDGAQRYPLPLVRQALSLAPGIPLMTCDAREANSIVQVLLRLVDHALDQTRTTPSFQDA
ncbi:ATP/GTP-binding protein [Streptomyces sp. NPDC058683]|uniref:GTP-binding protein n=1 Tax=Streptomyces sp. NPDC058683 TaxID=3346597 RepID=UPI003655587E